MKEEQLRKLIREMVMAEMGKPEIDKTIETIGDYEIYQPGEYYEHDPEYGTDPTPFAVRNKHTKQKVKDSDGLYYYHPDNRYYMNYGVDEEGDGLSFSTGKELVDYLTTKKDDPVNEVDECWECYQTGVNEATGEIMEECYRTTRWYMVPDTDEHTCDGEDEFYQVYGDFDDSAPLTEAMYRGRKVKLGKPMRGDVKKFKVFVRKPNGNIVKVNFGDKNMRIKKSNPKRRKSFRARHKCKTPGPRWKARYWSCRKW